MRQQAQTLAHSELIGSVGQAVGCLSGQLQQPGTTGRCSVHHSQRIHAVRDLVLLKADLCRMAFSSSAERASQVSGGM